MAEFEDMRRDAPAREPAINLPWPVGALILVLVGAHAARVLTGGDIERFALTSIDMQAGRYTGLITHQFVHGGWIHVLMNAAFVLAFGAPVARYLGGGLRGGAAFIGFFLVCGVIAALAYAGVADLIAANSHVRRPWALVGASGAASGLMGAAVRLMEGRGRLGPIFGRLVGAMTLSWILVNVVLGVSGLTPGANGVPVAWEAHIFGYCCGLLAISPFAWVAGVKDDHANAR
jgi:membrane associated rhomboid family serine protease